jgi:hypothetical protein
MSVRPIPCLLNDGDGLDFQEFLDDADFMRQVVRLLSSYVGEFACYALRLHRIEGGTSWFEPYGLDGFNGLLSNLKDDLPKKVDYFYLVNVRQGTDAEWPILGQWLPTPGVRPQFPNALTDSPFHGQIRFQKGEVFEGYLKVVCLPSYRGSMAFDTLLADAHAQVQAWMRKTIPRRQFQLQLLGVTNTSNLEVVHQKIEELLHRGDVRAAVRLVCTLITSHLGAGLNRVACLVPDAKGDLSCVWAHGGNCSSEFAHNILWPCTTNAPTIHQLVQMVAGSGPPIDDAYFCDLAMGKHRLRLLQTASSQSLVARIWRSYGELDGLPGDSAVVLEPGMDLNLTKGVIIPQEGYALAARLTDSDPLVSAQRNSHPDSSLFANQNKTWYAMPWRWSGNCLAVMVFDQGYWRDPVEPRDIIPRLVRAAGLLSAFAPHFDGVDLAAHAT